MRRRSASLIAAAFILGVAGFAPADDQRRSELVATIAIALEIHAQIEEELFYPCFAALSGLIPEARRQHAQMRSLVANIECLDPTSPDFILEVGQLRDTLQLHVA